MRNVAETLSDAASQTTSGATRMAKAAYDAAGNIVGPSDHSMSGQASEAYRGFRKTLAEMFDKQPLLLGAVGIAVGAGIAASLPASDVENRLMGDTADSLKDKAQEFWDETTSRAELMAAKGLEEAKAQGLTPTISEIGIQPAIANSR